MAEGPSLTKLFYKPAEVGELCSMGRTAVWDAIRSGELRSAKHGRARLVPVDALLEFAEKITETAL